VITRTFEEVSGRSICNVHHELVYFNNDEKELYKKAVEEFFSMKYLFTSTGNARKDRMMEIIQQLSLMLRICAMPNTFKEYKSTETPNKYKKVLQMVNKWDNEYVAIGCRNIKEVYSYYNLFSKDENRKVFLITGQDTTLQQRKAILESYKNSKNGILISTQQALSSSISIGYVNKIVLTSQAWNNASMSQYWGRFARFDSIDDKKDVYIVSYAGTIESNLTNLILSKERLNMFMRDVDIDETELCERFGISFNLVDMLITKERDVNTGKTYLRWGQQDII
jgi:superfamily II DNA/RNA helicase